MSVDDKSDFQRGEDSWTEAGQEDTANITPMFEYERLCSSISEYCNECNEKDEDWKVSCLLKTAIELESSRIEDLSTATNLSRSWIAMVHARMERSGIWANGRVDLEEFLTCSWDEGWPIFCHFHLLVAEGKIARTEEQRDGQYVYRASELGKAHEAAAKLLKEKPASPMVQ